MAQNGEEAKDVDIPGDEKNRSDLQLACPERFNLSKMVELA